MNTSAVASAVAKARDRKRWLRVAHAPIATSRASSPKSGVVQTNNVAMKASGVA